MHLWQNEASFSKQNGGKAEGFRLLEETPAVSSASLRCWFWLLSVVTLMRSFANKTEHIFYIQL